MENQEMTVIESIEEPVVKKARKKMTEEEKAVKRRAASQRTYLKRKEQGLAAKQFFIHRSLFDEAIEAMKPILEKTKAILAEAASK